MCGLGLVGPACLGAGAIALWGACIRLRAAVGTGGRGCPGSCVLSVCICLTGSGMRGRVGVRGLPGSNIMLSRYYIVLSGWPVGMYGLCVCMRAEGPLVSGLLVGYLPLFLV